jgi:AraC-like DNA-binding protein
VLPVSGLLRELIDTATRAPVEYEPTGRDGMVMDLLLAELRGLTPGLVPDGHLPTPDDDALTAVCAAVEQDPGRAWTLTTVARHAHLSTRTLSRRFQRATGMTVAHFVRQARLNAALRLLARGVAVSTVASDLGYATPSAFTAMFRRALGTTPARYFDPGSFPGSPS